jgi:uncharacterized protein
MTVSQPTSPPGWRHLALDSLPREPWRNGQGWTRPVEAAWRDGRLDWRASIAEIDRAAQFSIFPGLDRSAVLVRGGPVLLRAPDRQWLMQVPGDLAHFPGEWMLENAAPQTPALLWNLMVSRTRTPVEVTVYRDSGIVLPATGTVLAWVMQGHCSVTRSDGSQILVLAGDEGLVGEADRSALVLAPASPGTALLLTRLK